MSGFLLSIKTQKVIFITICIDLLGKLTYFSSRRQQKSAEV